MKVIRKLSWLGAIFAIFLIAATLAGCGIRTVPIIRGYYACFYENLTTRTRYGGSGWTLTQAISRANKRCRAGPVHNHCLVRFCQKRYTP